MKEVAPYFSKALLFSSLLLVAHTFGTPSPRSSLISEFTYGLGREFPTQEPGSLCFFVGGLLDETMKICSAKHRHNSVLCGNQHPFSQSSASEKQSLSFYRTILRLFLLVSQRSPVDSSFSCPKQQPTLQQMLDWLFALPHSILHNTSLKFPTVTKVLVSSSTIGGI